MAGSESDLKDLRTQLRQTMVASQEQTNNSVQTDPVEHTPSLLIRLKQDIEQLK